MPIGHFAVGTSVTTAMFHMLPLPVRIKMRIAQVFIFILAGLWAMLPDVAQFTHLMHYLNAKYWVKIELLQQTRFSNLAGLINRIETFHHSRWANVCFFHQFMDVTDKGDSPLIAGVLVLVMASVVSFILLRELQEKRASENE